MSKDAAVLGEARSSGVLLGRLSVMMFLQYFVQGAYLPIASVYVKERLGFTPWEVGIFGSAMAVGPVLAPFIVGQLVDRWFATEKVTAACHMVGGVIMLLLWRQTEVWPVIVLGTAYSILYVPTMMLTNSLAFQHLRNSDMEFPRIRLLGTLGFIVPAYVIELWWLHGLKGDELNTARAFAFLLSGIVGIGMGMYCLTLPHTPPSGKKRDYAPGVVISLLRKRDFLVLVVVSFLIAMVHQFVVVWYSPFMRTILDKGGWGAWEQRISSFGQVCEIGVLATLGFMIKRWGFKRTMLLGACAYLVRNLLFTLVFALDIPFAGQLCLAGAGQTLHGFCFGCFMAVAYVYVDKIALQDVRGSMQTLYGAFVLALGFFVGGVLSGAVADLYTVGTGKWAVQNWTVIWLNCAAISLICVLLFAGFFPRESFREESTAKP
jgi:nucleoside transporter